MTNSTAVGTIKMDKDVPPTIAIMNKSQVEFAEASGLWQPRLSVIEKTSKFIKGFKEPKEKRHRL